MAGLISKKVRGLNVKNWVVLQLFLNCSGPWVNSRKVQGLFNKKGQAEPVRTDLIRWLSILRFRSKGYAVLILCIGVRSGGQDWLGARGGGEGHRRPFSAAARGGNSPEFTNLGAPGAYSSGS